MKPFGPETTECGGGQSNNNQSATAGNQTHRGNGSPLPSKPRSTLTLLDVISRKIWKQRPDDEEYQRTFFVGITLHDLAPQNKVQQELFRRPRQSHPTLHHDGQNQPQARPHHTALREGTFPARKKRATQIAFTKSPCSTAQIIYELIAKNSNFSVGQYGPTCPYISGLDGNDGNVYSVAYEAST